MPLLTPRRVETSELLDEQDVPYDDMARSLRDLRRINRFAGGVPIYRRLVRRMVSKVSPHTLVDLGTGTSDLPASLGSYPQLVAIGIDVKIEHLLYGRRTGRDAVRRVVADANHLPFKTSTIDIVTSAHFFHHFTADENRLILEESLRIAKTGVIVNDTRRHYVPLIFVRFLALFRLVGRITRFDAEASVLRAYTINEARRCAAATSARQWRLLPLFPFRFGLLLWK